MSEYKRECNVRVVCKIFTVIDNVESDDIVAKYTDRFLSVYEIAKIKGCSPNEIMTEVTYGERCLNEYAYAFSNNLEKLLIDVFGASHTYIRRGDRNDMFIDSCGNVVMQYIFTQIAFTDDLDDEFEPYEDVCYLVEKVQNSINCKDVTMKYDVYVDQIYIGKSKQ